MLKSNKGGGVYFCYSYALNWHFVYLAIPETHPLFMKKTKFDCFIHMQPQKSEIHICSNKHEAGLLLLNCKFGNLRENFIFVNSLKRHICDVKILRLGHDLPISVKDRVIRNIARILFSRKFAFCENKTFSKISEFTVFFFSFRNHKAHSLYSWYVATYCVSLNKTCQSSPKLPTKPISTN